MSNDLDDDIHNMDPEKPGLDDETRARRRILQRMDEMTPEELFQIAVRAGIYTPDGQLTPPYRDDAEPSACRPRE
jgi:hypothetical protein